LKEGGGDGGERVISRIQKTRRRGALSGLVTPKAFNREAEMHVGMVAL
jgi:hypothetical protein